MTQEYVWKDTEMKSTFNIKPNYSIIFHRGNEQIGVLDFNGPEMTFSGDMDESAKLFLELVEKAFKTRLEQERAKEREACAIVCDDINAKYEWPDDVAERVASQWCADAIRARG